MPPGSEITVLTANNTITPRLHYIEVVFFFGSTIPTVFFLNVYGQYLISELRT